MLGLFIFAVDIVVIGLGGMLITATSFILSAMTITAGAIATILITSTSGRMLFLLSLIKRKQR